MAPSAVDSSQTAIHNGDGHFNEAQDKYLKEREKRIRPEGPGQFLDLYSLEKFRHFKSDPWLKETPENTPIRPEDGSQTNILIIGAGWAGLVAAVRLLKAGFKLEDMRIVDCAGGFGGTWYWNRYPGLNCDVESFIYMPFLEETGYVPTRKYVSGDELREHANRIAKKWNLDRIACFQQKVTDLKWDNEASEWTTTLVPQLVNGDEGAPLSVRSRFALLNTGLIFIPHIPRVPGIDKFQGNCFHPARWDYKCTGGTSEQPDLVKLKDKRVGIIGTGATAVQVVPHLAKWSKELIVFQRTPAAVDVRANEDTDQEWARALYSRKGWQRERQNNFHSFVTNDTYKPKTDMVSDGWTKMPSYVAMTGSRGLKIESAEAAKEYLEYLLTLDLPRQDRIRNRVSDMVEDAAVAEKLKPWYPSWCKRPTFHDEYLQSFNQPNVKLVDTSRVGISAITEDSVVTGDEEHKLDVLVLSTGYRSLFVPSPAGRVNIDITGRDGISFNDKWESGVTTLHGMSTHGFPNLFWPGLVQAGGSPNFITCIEIFATHISTILEQTLKSLTPEASYREKDGYKLNFTIEPTVEGEEAWTARCAAQAGAFSGIPVCTPNSYNAEGHLGENQSVKEQQKLAKMSLWAGGPEDYATLLEEWRASKKFEGVKIAPIH